MDVKTVVRPETVIEYPALTVVVDEARAAQLGLTATEAKHVQQLAAGWEQHEMAKREGITRNGMNMRMYRVRVRYGLRTCEQLIAWAYQYGVLVVADRG